MGFWGTFVVHRDERLLVELLPDVPAFGEGQLCYDGLAGGWQVTQVFANFSDLPTYFLADLREATAAPVLDAEVLDSDAAFVTGLGLQTPPWGAWLQLTAALRHLVPPPTPFDEDGNYLGDDWTDPDYEREVATVREEILAETPGGAVAAQAPARRLADLPRHAGPAAGLRRSATDRCLWLRRRVGAASPDSKSHGHLASRCMARPRIR